MRRPARGFTLIELLLVISIIILLMAVLVPTISAVRTSVRIVSTQERIAMLHQVIEQYHRAYNAYPLSTSPNRNMNKTSGDAYPPYCYPDGTEADYLFRHDVNMKHPFGGKFLAYFLMGPTGMGWHRPVKPRNTQDPNDRNRFLSAEWDVPTGLVQYLDNSPVGEGCRYHAAPCFVDAFGLREKNGGVIGYIAAKPCRSETAKWSEAGDGFRRAFYDDCEAGTGKRQSGREHQAKILEQCPYDFALLSTGPNGKYGYQVYGTKSGEKGWWPDLGRGVCDDIANFPRR